MNYIIVCVGLLTLNVCAAEKTKINIINKTWVSFIAYTKNSRNIPTHRYVSPYCETSFDAQNPQKVVLTWDDAQKQEIIHIMTNHPVDITIQPAIAIHLKEKAHYRTMLTSPKFIPTQPLPSVPENGIGDLKFTRIKSSSASSSSTASTISSSESSSD